MGEAVEVETAAKLAIDAREQIEVESGGHALRVVIGGQEDRRRFLEIDADEEQAVLAQEPRCIGEEGGRLFMAEIADGRAGEEAELRTPPRDRRQRHGAGKVGDERRE